MKIVHAFCIIIVIILLFGCGKSTQIVETTFTSTSTFTSTVKLGVRLIGATKNKTLLHSSNTPTKQYTLKIINTPTNTRDSKKPWTDDVYVQRNVKKETFGVTWKAGNLMLTIISPSNQKINRFTKEKNTYKHLIDIDEYFVVFSPESGNWQMIVEAIDVPIGGTTIDPYAFPEFYSETEMTQNSK
jgi:hypothetical protein